MVFEGLSLVVSCSCCGRVAAELMDHFKAMLSAFVNCVSEPGVEFAVPIPQRQ